MDGHCKHFHAGRRLWQHAGDKNLSRVVKIATGGRNHNYRLLTHAHYFEKKELWR